MSQLSVLQQRELQEIPASEILEKFGGRVLLLYKVANRMGALFIPYSAINKTILAVTMLEVSKEELWDLKEGPPEIKNPSAPSERYVITISNLTKEEVRDFTGMIYENSPPELIVLQRLWILNKISSAEEKWIREALRPIIENALYGKKFRVPLKEEKISFYSEGYLSRGEKQSIEDKKRREESEDKKEKERQEGRKKETFEQTLRKNSLVEVYPPLSRFSEQKKKDLKEIFNFLPSPEVKKFLLKILLDSPVYAELIYNLSTYLPCPVYEKEHYLKRICWLTSSLKYLIQEEQRLVTEYIETTKESKERSSSSSSCENLEGLLEEIKISLEDSDKSPFNKENLISLAFSIRYLDFLQIATIRSQKEALRMLRYYVGDYFDDLDLSNSVITGSAITASVYRPWGHQNNNLYKLVDKKKYKGIDKTWIDVTYPGYYSDPPADFPRESFEPNIIERDNFKYHTEFIRQNHPNGVSFDYKFVGGSDVDIAVLDIENFNAIAQEHIKTIKKRYPRLKVSAEERKKGVLYSLTDPQHLIRPIQIFPSSLEQIFTHHSAPVRGWFSRASKEKGDFFLAPSAVNAFIQKRVTDHYYFAGKSPYEIIYRLAVRGFDLQIPHPLYNFLGNRYEERLPRNREMHAYVLRNIESELPIPPHIRMALGAGFDLRTLSKHKQLKKILKPLLKMRGFNDPIDDSSEEQEEEFNMEEDQKEDSEDQEDSDKKERKQRVISEENPTERSKPVWKSSPSQRPVVLSKSKFLTDSEPEDS